MTIQALATGQIDVGGGATDAAFFNAFGRGATVRIVADKGSLQRGHGYQGLVVPAHPPASGPLSTPADLRGRKVAITSRGISTEIVIARLAERGGLTIDDVDLVSMGFGDMGSGAGEWRRRRGDVDRAEHDDLVGRGIGKIWLRNDEIIPDQQNAVLLYAESFAREQTDAALWFDGRPSCRGASLQRCVHLQRRGGA